ncbi:MAG: hypothetical protein PVI30_00050 [Myxococcales bacterium]
MGQGEALINVRSDVTLAIRSTRGTRTEHLRELTQVITDQMDAVRRCYRELVAKRPTTVGSLEMRVTLDPGEDPKLKLEEHGGTDPELTACIKRIFARVPFRRHVTGPAAAVVTLEFQNTRAKGQATMTERQQESADVRVQEGPDGFEATWTAPDGRVGFRVTSHESPQAVEATLRTLRKRFAGFLDCRRRAEKGGLSPAGEVVVEVRLQRGGKAAAKVKTSSVAHERAVPCVERAFRRLRFDDAPAGRRVRAHVRFAD